MLTDLPFNKEKGLVVILLMVNHNKTKKKRQIVKCVTITVQKKI